MKYLLIIVSVFCAILILFDISNAGYISEDLAAKISSVNPGEKISVVITLKETTPASILKKELNTSFKTLPERHKYGMAKLKADAAFSQSDILGSLRNLEISGLAQNLRSHWLINAITIDIEASELEKIASRDDVLFIFGMPEIKLIKPEAENLSTAQSLVGIESNIKATGADSAWKAGYTGKGRIVCSFDTGIDGHHPAISSNWKGLDGDSAAAWFDPIGRQSFPHPLGNPETNTYKHGTHTMGIMVGHDDLTGDTIGVAPDAKWISAAVIDISGASIIDAFEWAADPDGDPNTTSDVPDVINHSWGIANSYLGCNEYFWKMIDNAEALGIVNIFAAGNSGSGPQTITNPANRALDSLDCFAVGSVSNDSSKIVYWSSSRGPSDCDPTIIKPNLVAPGVDIRSALPPSYYGLMTGTSMAAPHVAGAVAILRQHSPDATADEIKKALLAGCERLPVGNTSPNNDYGWGLINIPAALAALSPALKPLLRLYSFNHPSVNPGDTVKGYVFIRNFGDTLQNVYGSIGEHSAGLDVLVNSLLFGTVGLNDTARSDIPFEAVISDTVTPGSVLTADMTLIGSPADTQHVRLYVRVGDIPHAGYFTHDNSLVKFTISNLGQYGFAPGSIMSLGYNGFAYRDTNSLFEGAFMVAVDSLHVSDGARNIVEEPDNDFAVAPGGDLLSTIPGQNADQQTFSIFDDSKAENPAGLEISQRTYSWNDPLYSNFVILEYTIKNLSQNNYTGVYAGLFFDWDIMTYTLNCGGFSSDENLGYLYYCRDVPNRFRGIAVINPTNLASYKLRKNPTFQGEINYSFTESEKYHALSSGIIDTAGAGTGDLAQIISAGPFSIAHGDSVKTAFAILAADSLTDLKTYAGRAHDQYFCSAANKPPVVTAPADTSIFVWPPGQICIRGFSVSDPNQNIDDVFPIGGTFRENSICFEPVAGENTIGLIARDFCGLADTAKTRVTVTKAYNRAIVDTMSMVQDNFKVYYGGGTATGKFFYHQGGENLFNSADMTHGNGDTLVYTIPSNLLTIRGLEYYFSVTHNGKTDSIGSPSSTYTIVVELSNNEAQRPTATLPNSYKIIGLPIKIAGLSNQVSAIFGDDLGQPDKRQWRLGSYNNMTGGYDEYPSASPVQPQQGYWLVTREPKKYGAAGYSMIPNRILGEEKYYESFLDSGWNQLANPFAFNIEWSKVRFGDAESLFTGHPAAILDDAAYWYTGSGYITQAEIVAWDGFFVNIKRPRIRILFPYVESSFLPLNLPKESKSEISSIDNWEIELQIESGGLKDGGNLAGVRPDASYGFDDYDYGEPPAPPDGPFLAFILPESNNGRHRIDFRPPTSDGARWNLVMNVLPNRKIRSIPHGKLPEGFSAWLLLDSGSQIQFCDNAVVPIPDEIQSAALVIGTQKFLGGDGISGLPQNFVLDQNCPNPFNPTTAIKFALPSRGTVKLEILNILGQTVRTLLNSEYPAGFHTILWNGNDSRGNPVASGVYLYRLSSGEKSLVKKMVLLK